MPRYSDEWVIDRVLFDYVSGGACACCGFQHFLPSGTAGLIEAVTDLESDAAAVEIEALDHHPWPSDLRDQVWADRVRLRQRLKREMRGWRDFWKEYGEGFRMWCYENADSVATLLRLRKSRVVEVLRENYKVHAAYAVVLCTVMEQVSFFHVTQYSPDGHGDVERAFESELFFDRDDGFLMEVVVDGEFQKEVLEVLLNRVESLGGPKLLEKGKSAVVELADDPDAPSFGFPAKSSFASDRRIIRLVIARIWAHILKEKYLDTVC